MKNSGRAKSRHLIEAVGEILFRDWDPLGVAENPSLGDEYRRSAATVVRLLWEGADESEITSYLSEVQEVSMGLSRVDSIRDGRVAQLLLALPILTVGDAS